MTRSMYYTPFFHFFVTNGSLKLWSLKIHIFKNMIDWHSTEAQKNKCVYVFLFFYSIPEIFQSSILCLSCVNWICRVFFFFLFSNDGTKWTAVARHYQNVFLAPLNGQWQHKTCVFSAAGSSANTFYFSSAKPPCLQPFKYKTSLTDSSRCSFSTGDLLLCREVGNGKKSSQSAFASEQFMFHFAITPQSDYQGNGQTPGRIK